MSRGSGMSDDGELDRSDCVPAEVSANVSANSGSLMARILPANDLIPGLAAQEPNLTQIM